MDLINALDAWKTTKTDPDTGEQVSLLRVFLDTLTAEFTVSGLKIGGRITEVELNTSTWTALPSTALASRNALSIQNRSGIEIKINYDNSVSSYTGIVIPNNGERYYDISDSIIIYAKSLTGTPIINIEEIA